MASEDKIRFQMENQQYQATQEAAAASHEQYYEANMGYEPYGDAAHQDPYAQYQE
jgi:hypothetical protein